MMQSAKQFLHRRWDAFSQTPFGCLVRLFLGRMFHGHADSDAGDLDLGIGVIVILLALPGVLVSLLMFEKYGSFIRFLRGVNPSYDPFSETIPDEYFFLVLSMVVSGVAALWRWDSIFLDRRDFMNLVPQPISLRSIFLANLSAIFALVALLTLVVNGVSMVLWPVAVVGSQPSFPVFFRFAVGHAVIVLLASAFSSLAVFGTAGILMTLLPAAVFRRVSLLARFTLALLLLVLLGTSLAVPDWLKQLSVANAHRVAVFPPVSFLGLLRTLWGRSDPFVATMTQAAVAALGAALFTTILAYAVSFRRSFMRIPETPDAGPLPRVPSSFSPLAPLREALLRTPSQRACYHFVARTLLRSDGHLQMLSGFLALGLVAAAATLSSAPNLHSLISGSLPPAEFLSAPFILAYCVTIGIRFAFEIPSHLPANWLFRFWLDRERHEARSTARRVLLLFSLPWLAPACFLTTLAFWGWTVALLHTAVVSLCTVALVEVFLSRFRKIPFTCPYPSFKSHSGLIGVGYLFGYLFFTYYLPQMEIWALSDPWRIVWFVALLGIVLGGIHFYRSQMIDLDKELVFEDVSASGFD